MRNRLLMASLLACLAVADASAQGIYKTIGPDGKPAFSDKPPTTAGAPVEIIKAPSPVAVAPAPEASASNDVPASEAPLESGAKRAKRAKPVLPAAPTESNERAPATPNAAVEKAVIGVLGLEDLMNQTIDLCMRTLPTSFGKYADAADAWRARNNAILTRAHAVLEKDLAAPRAVEAALKLRNNNSLAPVEDSNLGARIKWCNQSVGELNDGKMDPKTRPALAGPMLGGG